MAEVTWRTTIVGVSILFMIALVVATCLNYAQSTITSIQAGLDGPFRCRIESVTRDVIPCDDSGLVEDCYLVYVRTDDSNVIAARGVKLGLDYRHSNNSKVSCN